MTKLVPAVLPLRTLVGLPSSADDASVESATKSTCQSLAVRASTCPTPLSVRSALSNTEKGGVVWRPFLFADGFTGMQLSDIANALASCDNVKHKVTETGKEKHLEQWTRSQFTENANLEELVLGTTGWDDHDSSPHELNRLWLTIVPRNAAIGERYPYGPCKERSTLDGNSFLLPDLTISSHGTALVGSISVPAMNE